MWRRRASVTLQSFTRISPRRGYGTQSTTIQHISFLGPTTPLPTSRLGTVRARPISPLITLASGTRLLFDPPDNLQRAVLACPRFGRASHPTQIFVTSSHPNHIFGLLGILCTLYYHNKQSTQSVRDNMREKSSDDPSSSPSPSLSPSELKNHILVTGPKGISDFLNGWIRKTYTRILAKFRVYELSPQIPLLRLVDGIRIQGIAFRSFLPKDEILSPPDTYLYFLATPSTHRLNAPKAQLFGAQGSDLAVLKSGGDVTLWDGRVIRAEEVQGEKVSGRVVMMFPGMTFSWLPSVDEYVVRKMYDLFPVLAESDVVVVGGGNGGEYTTEAWGERMGSVLQKLFGMGLGGGWSETSTPSGEWRAKGSRVFIKKQRLVVLRSVPWEKKGSEAEMKVVQAMQRKMREGGVEGKVEVVRAGEWMRFKTRSEVSDLQQQQHAPEEALETVEAVMETSDEAEEEGVEEEGVDPEEIVEGVEEEEIKKMKL